MICRINIIYELKKNAIIFCDIFISSNYPNFYNNFFLFLQGDLVAIVTLNKKKYSQIMQNRYQHGLLTHTA